MGQFRGFALNPPDSPSLGEIIAQVGATYGGELEIVRDLMRFHIGEQVEIVDLGIATLIFVGLRLQNRRGRTLRANLSLKQIVMNVRKGLGISFRAVLGIRTGVTFEHYRASSGCL